MKSWTPPRTDDGFEMTVQANPVKHAVFFSPSAHLPYFSFTPVEARALSMALYAAADEADMLSPHVIEIVVDAPSVEAAEVIARNAIDYIELTDTDKARLVRVYKQQEGTP